MSSALIASTTPAESRLMFIDWLRLLRIPVTVTVSSVLASSLPLCVACCACGAVGASCANAGLITSTPPTKVNIARDFKLFSLRLISVPSSQ